MNLVGQYFKHVTIAPDCGGSRKKIEKILNCPPAPPNCQTFQDLSGKHKACDDQGSEELSNRQGSEKSDGHREFHRHLSFDDVLESFPENGISAD